MDFQEIVRDIDRQVRELQKARKALRKLGGEVGNGVRGTNAESRAGTRSISWAKVAGVSIAEVAPATTTPNNNPPLRIQSSPVRV